MKPIAIKTAIRLSLGAVALLALSLPASYAAEPTPCELANPISMVDNDNGARGAPTNKTLKVTFIGSVTNAKKLKSGGKQKLKACEGSRLEYRAESTAGTVSCVLDKKPLPPQGAIKVGAGVQRLVCMDKPDGGDMDQFQIAGVAR